MIVRSFCLSGRSFFDRITIMYDCVSLSEKLKRVFEYWKGILKTYGEDTCIIIMTGKHPEIDEMVMDMIPGLKEEKRYHDVIISSASDSILEIVREKLHDTVKYHKCDEDRYRPALDDERYLHTQPPEKACLSHSLDHYHHTGDKDYRSPVDALAFAFGYLIPEILGHKAFERKGIPYRFTIFHTYTEHYSECQYTASQSYIMALDLVENDHYEHCRKYHYGEDLCS